MFLVRTYLATSGIHGLGVFAAESIPAGTPIWRFDPAIDRVIPREVAAKLPPAMQDFLDTYTYEWPAFGEGYVLNGDHARFLNHSTDPNTDNSGPVTLASRDIAAGEEITCSYRECCADFDPAEVGEV